MDGYGLFGNQKEKSEFDSWNFLILIMLLFGWPRTDLENKEHINIESIYIEGPHFSDK